MQSASKEKRIDNAAEKGNACKEHEIRGSEAERAQSSLS